MCVYILTRANFDWRK